jgi:hypothetical protein
VLVLRPCARNNTTAYLFQSWRWKRNILLFCSLYLFLISFFFIFLLHLFLLFSFLPLFLLFLFSFCLSGFLSFSFIYSLLYPFVPFPSFIVSFIRFLCACLSCTHHYWSFVEHLSQHFSNKQDVINRVNTEIYLNYI